MTSQIFFNEPESNSFYKHSSEVEVNQEEIIKKYIILNLFKTSCLTLKTVLRCPFLKFSLTN